MSGGGNGRRADQDETRRDQPDDVTRMPVASRRQETAPAPCGRRRSFQLDLGRPCHDSPLGPEARMTPRVPLTQHRNSHQCRSDEDRVEMVWRSRHAILRDDPLHQVICRSRSGSGSTRWGNLRPPISRRARRGSTRRGCSARRWLWPAQRAGAAANGRRAVPPGVFLAADWQVSVRVRRPAARCCSPLMGRAGRPSKSLTLRQAEAVLKAAEQGSPRMRAYIVVSLLTGARTEEMRALR